MEVKISVVSDGAFFHQSGNVNHQMLSFWNMSEN
jgi:hypothetical protein